MVISQLVSGLAVFKIGGMRLVCDVDRLYPCGTSQTVISPGQSWSWSRPWYRQLQFGNRCRLARCRCLIRSNRRLVNPKSTAINKNLVLDMTKTSAPMERSDPLKQIGRQVKRSNWKGLKLIISGPICLM